MSKEDKQVIDMANSAGERRRAEELERFIEEAHRRIMKQLRFRRLLLRLITALLWILAACLVMASLVAGRVPQSDVVSWCALILVEGIAGGMSLAEALRW